MEKEYKGYIIEPDYGGDSDNFARFLIKDKNGKILFREVYEYAVKSTIDKLIKSKNKKLKNKENIKTNIYR